MNPILNKYLAIEGKLAIGIKAKTERCAGKLGTFPLEGCLMCDTKDRSWESLVSRVLVEAGIDLDRVVRDVNTGGPPSFAVEDGVLRHKFGCVQFRAIMLAVAEQL